MKSKAPMVDRIYRLTKEEAPLAYMIPAQGNARTPLLYWDDDAGVNKTLRYARNQKSPFVDEQDGNVVLEPIVFEDGFLSVPRQNPVLQEFLQYHPLNGIKFEEINNERDAHKELEAVNLEVDALIQCREMSIEQIENVARVVFGMDPSSQTTSELRRDMLIFARHNAEAFLQAVNDPELNFNASVQGFFDKGLLTFRKNKQEIWFNTSTNKKKMLTVPFGDDPMTAAGAYLMGDNGLDHLNMLESAV